MKVHKLPTAQERERERLARLREKVREMVPEFGGAPRAAMLDLAGTDQRTRIRNDALGRPQRRHSQTFLLSPEWPHSKLDVDKLSLSHTGLPSA